MYLHFGYPLQLMNSPYCPFRSSSGLPHFGQLSSSCTGGFCCTFCVSLRIVLQGGSSLYPGQAINGPHGPFRSTIVRPQLSQASSSGAATNSFSFKTSFEYSITSSVVAFTMIGNVNAVVTFFSTAFWSFFHGPAAIVIGLALEKLLQE